MADDIRIQIVENIQIKIDESAEIFKKIPNVALKLLVLSKEER